MKGDLARHPGVAQQAGEHPQTPEAHRPAADARRETGSVKARRRERQQADLVALAEAGEPTRGPGLIPAPRRPRRTGGDE